jgi:hypothetical protein
MAVPAGGIAAFSGIRYYKTILYPKNGKPEWGLGRYDG